MCHMLTYGWPILSASLSSPSCRCPMRRRRSRTDASVNGSMNFGGVFLDLSFMEGYAIWTDEFRYRHQVGSAEVHWQSEQADCPLERGGPRPMVLPRKQA